MNDSPISETSRPTELNFKDIDIWYQKFISETNSDTFAIGGEFFNFWSNHFKGVILNGNLKELKGWLNRFGYGDEATAKKIAATNKSSVCGAALKSGQIGYSCLQCQLDDSCVLCPACWDPSKHVGHDYSTIIISGGCCDCGDVEAWNPNGFCNAHGGHHDEVDMISLLPSELVKPLSVFLNILLGIFVGILCGNEDYQLVLFEYQKTKTTPNVLCIFDDDIHTFEEVSAMIVQYCDIASATANDMVLRIDHIGSSPIFLGSAHKCKELITQLSEHNVRSEIVKPADYITVKRFLSFTDWLMEFVSYHAAFKALATKEFQSTYGENYANNQHFLSDENWLTKLLLVFDSLPKALKVKLQKLIFDMLCDQNFRMNFSISFTHIYEKQMHYYCHSPKSPKLALHDFSVQILSSPISTSKLVTDHSLLEHIFASLETEILANVRDPTNGIVNFHHPLTRHFSPFWIIEDFKYVFSIRSNVEWMLNHPELMTQWIKTITCAQYAAHKKRITDKHIEREGKDFFSALAFSVSVKGLASDPVINTLKKNVTEDLEVDWTNSIIDQLLQSSVSLLQEWFALPLFGMDSLRIVYITHEIISEKHWVIDSNVLSSEISIHLPLQRFFAEVALLKLTTLKNTKEDLFSLVVKDSEVEKKLFIARLMEMPLRIQIFIKQVNTGLWVRNGIAVQYETQFYTNPFQSGLYLNCFELDLTLIQICAVLLDDTMYFLTYLVESFKLGSFVDANSFAALEIDTDQLRFDFNMCESLLLLLTHILSSRAMIGDNVDKMKEFVIHQLWLGKTAASKLTKLFPNDTKQIIEILNEVGVFSEASGFKQGGYSLKKSHYKDYNPTYPFYSFEERQKAQELYAEYQENEAKLQNKSVADMEHIEINTPAPLISAMTPLLEIYSSHIFHKIIFQTLMRASLAPKIWATRSILGTTLHLIQLAIKENKIDANFLSMAAEFLPEKSTLILLLNLLNDQNLEIYFSAIRWILIHMKKIPEFDAIITKNMSVEAIKSIDEKEIRKQRALEARNRKLQKMKENSEKVSEQLNNEKMDIVSTKTHQHTQECILCHENHRDFVNHPWGIISTLEKTTLPSLVRLGNDERGDECTPETYFHSCGHTMHQQCYDKHMQNVCDKYDNYESFEGDHLDPKLGLYSCPMCKNISNTLLLVVQESALVTTQHKINLDERVNSEKTLSKLQEHAKLMNEKFSAMLIEESKTNEELPIPTPLDDVLEGLAFKVTNMKENAEDEFPKSIGFKFVDLEKCISSTLDSFEISARSTTSVNNIYFPADLGMIKTRDLQHLRVLLEYYVALYIHSDKQPNNTQIMTKKIVEAFSTLVGCSTEGGIESQDSLFSQDIKFVFIQLLLIPSILKTGGDSNGFDFDLYRSTFFLLLRSLFAMLHVRIGKDLLLFEFYESLKDYGKGGDEGYDLFLNYNQMVVSTQSSALSCSVGQFHFILIQFLPFLRQVTILYLSLTQNYEKMQLVPSPQGDNLSAIKEISSLLEILNMGTFNDLIARDSVHEQVINTWFHPLLISIDIEDCSEIYLGTLASPRVPIPFNLHQLPLNFQDFLQTNEHQLSFHICLICGTYIFTGEKTFKGYVDDELVETLETHYHECNAATCVFFGLLANKMIALTQYNLFYFLPTPYLDQYGEMSNIKRGATLTLRADRYEKIRRNYVSNRIGYEDAILIARDDERYV